MLMENCKVLTYVDGKYVEQNIQDLKAGDIVVGAEKHLNKLIAINPSLMNGHHDVYTFEGSNIRFADTQQMFIRRNGTQMWAMVNWDKANNYYSRMVDGISLRKTIVTKIVGEENYQEPLQCVSMNETEEFATTVGWSTEKPIKYTPTKTDNKIWYHLYADGTQSAYVDGFLVAAYPTNDMDYNAWNVEKLDITNE